MPPKKNIKTLYSNSNNVDITSLLSTSAITNNLTTIGQLGGGSNKKTNKKNKKKEEYSEDEESDYSDSQYGSGESEEEEQEEEEQEEEEQEEEEQEEEEEPEDKNETEPETEDEDKEEQDLEDDEDKATIDTNNKCYSKYAKDDGDFDLDEYFKDDDITITKTGRVGKPILYKYEMVRILSDRSRQLAEGAKPMIKNTTGLSHKEIALLELKNKIIPLIIERPIPNSGTERWKLSELDIPNYD
jgi:DNA-directed RNA polymerase subunit K/omega